MTEEQNNINDNRYNPELIFFNVRKKEKTCFMEMNSFRF